MERRGSPCSRSGGRGRGGEVVDQALDGGLVSDVGDGAEPAATARAGEGVDRERTTEELGPVQPWAAGQQLASVEAVQVTHGDDVDAVEDLELDARRPACGAAGAPRPV